MKLIALISALFLAYTTLSAADMPSREEIDAALKECFESVSTDSSGKPDRDAVDACMSEKGYTKPSGGPGENQDGERPPMR